LKVNEARTLFRILAAIVAILAAAVAGSDLLRLIRGSEFDRDDWQFLATSVFAFISFSFVTFSGYMPKALLYIWTRGSSVAEDKDLR